MMKVIKHLNVFETRIIKIKTKFGTNRVSFKKLSAATMI